MRRSFRNTFVVALLTMAGVLAGAPPILAHELPKRILAAGRLVIGTYPNYPPITYKDPYSMKLTGFDIELGEAIGRELGLSVEWQEIAFAQMLPALKTGRVDMILAFMADTEKRRATFDFVDYLRSQAVVSVRAGDEARITLATLCGKRIGASRSGTWPSDIAAWSASNCEARGEPGVIVAGTEGSFDARMQLRMGRLDAAIHGSETIAYFEKLEPGRYVPIGSPFPAKLVGIPFLKTGDGRLLRDAVKAALERMLASGVYGGIVARYGVEHGALDAITVNAGQ
ncbi:MAG: ABC transporter substrate-binding protein [Hyphomicrobiaceae bacterium]|nr:ABC transporter substrate-binding protein [Hyphomicrobiaceae bacterium]